MIETVTDLRRALAAAESRATAAEGASEEEPPPSAARLRVGNERAMPTLTFDRKVPLCEQRLAVALAKCKRKQGKKHGTGKETAAVRRAKKAAVLAKVRANNKARAKKLAAHRAYWAGLTDMSGQLISPPRV